MHDASSHHAFALVSFSKLRTLDFAPNVVCAAGVNSLWCSHKEFLFLIEGINVFFVYDKKLPRALCLLNLLSINKQQVSISRCWLVKALHRGIFEESVIQVIWDLGRLLHEARRQDLQHWRLEDRVGCHVRSDVQSVDAQSVNLKKSATYCVTAKLSTHGA